MRSIFYTCSMLFLCGFMAFGQVSNAQTSEDPGMTAVLEIKKQTYCSSGQILLEIRATFTNSSSATILLNRRTKSSLNGIVVPIEGGDALEFHSPLFDANQLVEKGYLDTNEPDIKNFVSLGPGDSFSIRTNFDRIAVQSSQDDDEGDPSPGKYTLKMKFSTWFHHPNYIGIFQERWRDKGFLWTNEITSRPMEFEILKNPKLVPCKIKRTR